MRAQIGGANTAPHREVATAPRANRAVLALLGRFARRPARAIPYAIQNKKLRGRFSALSGSRFLSHRTKQFHYVRRVDSIVADLRSNLPCAPATAEARRPATIGEAQTAPKKTGMDHSIQSGRSALEGAIKERLGEPLRMVIGVDVTQVVAAEEQIRSAGADG